jgi:MFS family permease
MQGSGEQYLSAFALLLHATPLQVGLLSAVPQLVGTWMQLLSVKALNRLHHRKTVILAGAVGQALSWLPLLALPLLAPAYGPWILIACTIAYFGLGHFAVPAWNSLITDLVSPNERGTYFARRSKVMTVLSFAALCAAGLVLHWAETQAQAWVGFALIFLAASIARLLSARYLSLMDESAAQATREAELRLFEFLRHERCVNYKHFLWFSGLMHVCVLIAGPYFVIYLLQDLHFSYWMYAAWLAAGVLGQFLTLKPWGRLSDRFGNKKLLVITGLIVPFLPMLYLIDTSVWYLVAVNGFGGMIWAGLSLGLQNYVFDAVHPEDRAKGVAVWNTVNAAGWFGGAMLGSWLATVLPTRFTWAGLDISLASNLQAVFFLSGILRLIVSLSLLRTFHEVRPVEPITHRRLVTELPFIKPLTDVLAGRGSRQ